MITFTQVVMAFVYAAIKILTALMLSSKPIKFLASLFIAATVFFLGPQLLVVYHTLNLLWWFIVYYVRMVTYVLCALFWSSQRYLGIPDDLIEKLRNFKLPDVDEIPESTPIEAALAEPTVEPPKVISMSATQLDMYLQARKLSAIMRRHAYHYQRKVEEPLYAPYVEIAKTYFKLVLEINHNWLVIIATFLITVSAIHLLRKLFSKRFYLFSRLQKHGVDTFMEKMRAGSLLESISTKPKFQVDIWTRNENTMFIKRGQGFLTKFGLTTAYHVVEDSYEVKIVSHADFIIISGDRFEQVESDIGLTKLLAHEILKLQLKTARLVEFGLNHGSGLLVRIQAFGSMTMGKLDPDLTAFGLTLYSGSTVPGFSGAPYYVGNCVYGMHIGGNSINVGYEAAYVHMVSSKGQESTEDYLIQQITRYQDYDWERNPYNPDEARLRVGGKYYTVEVDTMDNIQRMKPKKAGLYHKPTYEPEAQGTLVKAEELPLTQRGELTYDDQKNLTGPTQSGYVSVPALGHQQPQIPVQQLNHQGSCSTAIESQTPLAACPTHGHQRTSVPQNEASQSIPKSSKTLKAKERRQRRTAELRRLRQLEATLRGKQTSQEPTTSTHGSTTNSTPH